MWQLGWKAQKALNWNYMLPYGHEMCLMQCAASPWWWPGILSLVFSSISIYSISIQLQISCLQLLCSKVRASQRSPFRLLVKNQQCSNYLSCKHFVKYYQTISEHGQKGQNLFLARQYILVLSILTVVLDFSW